MNSQRIKQSSLASNSIFYLIYNILNVVFPLVTGIYVARVLLPGDIGQVEIAKNLASYFVIFSFLGLPTYGLREISKVRDNEKELNKLYTELRIINTISTFVFLALYIAVILIVPAYRNSITIFLISGLSIALNFLNNTWLFEGLEQFKYISVRNIIFKAVSFILLIIFVRRQDDYLIYALITVVGTAGNYILNMIASKKYVKPSFKNINLAKHLKPIFFLVTVNLAIEIYTMVDITMLGFMCEEETVAFYSYGIKIQKIFMQIINTFTIIVVPRLSFLYKKEDYDNYNTLLAKTLKIIILLSVPMIIGIWFVSDYVICGVYGPNYYNSAGVLKILSLAILVSPIGYLLGSRVMLVTGNEKKMLIPVACGAITNIICNILLISLLKEKGAAIASIVGEIVVAIIYILLSHNYFKLELKSLLLSVIKIFASSFLMAIMLLLLSFLKYDKFVITILQIILGAILYFVFLLLMKEKTIYSCVEKIIKKV